MVVVGGELDRDALRRWVGVGEPPPRAADGAPAPLRRYALVSATGTPGIVSEFGAHGQIVVTSIMPEHLDASAARAAEWSTLLERIAFRHRLNRIVCTDARMLPAVWNVAHQLDLSVASSVA
jgi:hypothetical protein